MKKIEQPEAGNKNRGTKESVNGITSDDIETTLGIDQDNPKFIRRIMGYGLVLIVVLAVVLWGWNRLAGSELPNYISEPVIRGDLTLVVSATGDLQAVNTVEVGSEISGLIKSVYVDYNDRVSTGQLLAKLDTDRLEDEVAQARAALNASEASLTLSQASLEEQRTKNERNEELAKQSLISPQDLEGSRAGLTRAEASADNALAQIVKNKAALNTAETTLKKASIRSPVDGIVLINNIKPGQAVAASFQTPVLFTLAEDLTRMELHVDIDEADIGLVTEGQPATFTVDAYPDSTFPAEITKVYYASRSAGGVVTYEAILSVGNKEMLLRPGMTATADIITKEENDVVLVSNSALRFTPPGENKPFGEGSIVWIMEDKKPVAIRVRTGLTDGRYTQIVSGDLQPGQKLLVNIQREK